MIRRRLFRIGLPLLALVALVSAGLSVWRSNSAMEAPAPAAVAVAPVVPAEVVVAAIGRTEPAGGTLAIGADLAGTIADLAVEVGQHVAAGDLLFTLDDRTALRRVAEREAELASARARLAQTEAQTAAVTADLAAAGARVASAEAALSDLARDLEVARTLAARDAAAAREVERRSAALVRGEADRDAALAEVARVEAALARLDPVTGADLIAARAAVEEAQARLDSALSDLAAHRVIARSSGTVLTIDLRAGEEAGPSAAVLTLAAGEGAVLRVFVDEVDAARVDTARPATAAPRGGTGGEVAIIHVATEPEVRPNTELSGRPDGRIDTRVVEFLYRLPPEAAVPYGRTFDVTLPGLPPDPGDAAARSLAGTPGGG